MPGVSTTWKPSFSFSLIVATATFGVATKTFLKSSTKLASLQVKPLLLSANLGVWRKYFPSPSMVRKGFSRTLGASPADRIWGVGVAGFSPESVHRGGLFSKSSKVGATPSTPTNTKFTARVAGASKYWKGFSCCCNSLFRKIHCCCLVKSKTPVTFGECRTVAIRVGQ